MSLEPPLFPTVFNQLLFKTVLELATDLVPNIRMGIAKCLSTALTRQHVFDSEKQFEETVQILRQFQRCSRNCSALPPQDDTEDNQNATDDNDHRCVEASISNASTVDMNCTFELRMRTTVAVEKMVPKARSPKIALVYIWTQTRRI